MSYRREGERVVFSDEGRHTALTDEGSHGKRCAAFVDAVLVVSRTGAPRDPDLYNFKTEDGRSVPFALFGWEIEDAPAERSEPK